MSTLKRILDTSRIDMRDQEIRKELNIDLKRMNKLTQIEAPEGTTVYLVKVSPSDNTYYPGFYRFRFEIQYGKLEDKKFIPLSGIVRHTTETLPMI